MSENKDEIFEDDALNPQVSEVKIGIRKLRTIKIYPLSMADQSKVTAILTKEIAKFFAGRDVNSIPVMEFIDFIIKAIQKNFVEILKYITDPEDVGDYSKILSEISNLQAAEIASLVYEVNYAALANVKNVKSLLNLIKSSFQLRGQSLPYVNDTDTDQKTSTEKVTEKEE